MREERRFHALGHGGEGGEIRIAGAAGSGGIVKGTPGGNGAAALALLKAGQQAGKSLAVTGVDAAAIDPHRYASRHGDLIRKIAFHANTRMEELPLESASVDAVISQFGAALRKPIGRIHWAGTETATVSHGTIDGAIRSGERAALEVVEKS